MKTCGKCGASSSMAARYCASCGAKLEAAPSPRASPPTATNAKTNPQGKHILYVAPPNSPERLSLATQYATDHIAYTIVADNHHPVQTRIAQLDTQGIKLYAVCILGSHEEIPHAEFPDETGTGTTVYTDNDFGMVTSVTPTERTTTMALPDVAVCRIPTDDINLLARLLQVRDHLSPTWNEGLAVSCDVWREASAEVLRTIARLAPTKLDCVPPNNAADIAAKMGPSVGRLYFNVHGSDQVPYWVGDGAGGAPPALHPRDVRIATNAIMVSEACFGARHDTEDGETVVSAFFRNGGSAFVGSTIIAWGPVAPPIGSADLIVTGVYEALDRGETIAAACLSAKQKIVAAVGEPLSPIECNTVSSFVVYGPPLASVHGAKAHKTAASRPAANSTGIENILERTRAGRSGNTTGPLAEARARLAARAARMNYAPVTRQAISYEELFAVAPRSTRLLDHVKSILGEGGKALTLEYPARVGTEKAIVTIPQKNGYASFWTLDRLGNIRNFRVTRRLTPKET